MLFSVLSSLSPNDATVLIAINAAMVRRPTQQRSHLQVRQHCRVLIMVLGTLYQMV